MKVLMIILILGFIFCQVPDANAEWDKTDKTLFIAYATLQAVSLAQANYIFENADEFGAYKPFLTARRKIFLPVYYIGAVLGAGYLADKVSPIRRKLLLGTFILISLDIISDNLRIGIGFTF